MDVECRKEEIREEEETEEQIEARFIKVIGPAVFLNVVSAAMLFTARQAFAGPLFKTETQLATFLTRLTSAAAFVEFLVNPILGKLSDTYGRKVVIPLGNLATCICRFTIFMNSTEIWPLIMEQLVTTPLITSFFTTWRASLSDGLEGAPVARTNAKIGVCAGLAIIVGPFMSKTIMNRADPKYCFLASTFFSAIALAHLSLNFKESLPVENRKPLKIADMQPFSFTQLMGKSKELRTLMWVTGLQTTSEGRNVNDIFSIYMQNDLGWSWDQINNFVGALGLSLVFSGLGVKRMMGALGMRTFTTFSNMANAASMLAYAHCPPLSALTDASTSMWLGLLFAIPGARKRDAVEALLMKIGAAEGFGKGFLSGSLMNWRAVINVVGPMLFGSMYTYGHKKGFPGLVFVAGAVTVAVAEMTLQTLPAEIFIDIEKERNSGSKDA